MLFTTNRSCDSCYGTKTTREGNEPCYDCKGFGRELTHVGRELVELMSRYYDLKPKIEDMAGK